MGDIVEQIDAALDGRCACGCGAKITDRSPSAYFAREHCHARWMAQQRGLPAPVDPDQPPASPAPPRAPSTPRPVPADTPAYGLALLLRQGWRYATASTGPLPGVPVPWRRRCGECHQLVTPVDGMRALPITFDMVERPPESEPLELERANICPSCHQPFIAPHLTAMWRPGPYQTYQLALVHGEQYARTEVSHEALRYAHQPDMVLEYAWRQIERWHLERLAPRCEHPAGCTTAARDRYHLGAAIQWAGTLLYPGRSIVLCGPHGGEFQRHIYTSTRRLDGLDSLINVVERVPLGWTRR